jgi:hypothetical protein
MDIIFATIFKREGTELKNIDSKKITYRIASRLELIRESPDDINFMDIHAPNHGTILDLKVYINKRLKEYKGREAKWINVIRKQAQSLLDYLSKYDDKLFVHIG